MACDGVEPAGRSYKRAEYVHYNKEVWKDKDKAEMISEENIRRRRVWLRKQTRSRIRPRR